MRKIFYKTQSSSLIGLIETPYTLVSDLLKNQELIIKDAMTQLNKGKNPLSKITVAEDLHYSTCSLKDDKEFITSLLFDLDYIDQEKKDLYIQAFSEACNISASDIGIIDSGGGLHFVLDLTEEISQQDPNFHLIYHETCEALNKILRAKQLVISDKNKKTHFDKSMFIPHKTLRLPGTVNAKYDPPRMCRVLQGNISSVNFTEFCNVVKKSSVDVMSSQGMIFESKGEAAAVLNGCKFLQHYSNNQHEQTMPIWQAMGQAYLNFADENKEELFFEASRLYPNFDEAQFQKVVEKITTNELSSYGCRKINELWGRCHECKYDNLVKSPLQIRGEGHVPNGGWIQTGTEAKPKWIPNYRALLAKYKHDNNFVLNFGQSIHGKLNTEKGIWEFDYTRGLPALVNDLKHFLQKNLSIPESKGEIANEKNKFVDFATSEICNVSQEQIDFARMIPNCLSFKNGIFNVITGERIGDATTHFITQRLSYDYNPNVAVPKLWECTVDQWFKGNQDLIDQLGYTFAHVLSDYDYNFHAFHYWFGDGGNGKSLAVDILGAIAGGHSVVEVSNFGSHKELTPLTKYLFNVNNEFNPDKLASGCIEALKKLADGSTFEYSAKFVNTRETRSIAKHLIVSNHEFHISTENNAITRRIRILPFLYSSEEQGTNINLKDDLSKPEMLSGIFNWVVAYIKKLNALRGIGDRTKAFPNPDICKKWIENFRDKTNPMNMFIDSYVLSPKDLNGSRDKLKCVRPMIGAFFNTFTKKILGTQKNYYKRPEDLYRDFEKTYFKKTNSKIESAKTSNAICFKGVGFNVKKFTQDLPPLSKEELDHIKYYAQENLRVCENPFLYSKESDVMVDEDHKDF